MLDPTYYRRLLAPPAGSFFLFGLRGVGKSTWAQAAFPAAHVIDLLDESLYHTLLGAPETFAAEIRQLPPATPVVLDEVQRLPSCRSIRGWCARPNGNWAR